MDAKLVENIASSLARMVEMMGEDRKPRIELAPEGWISQDEHQRMLREGLAADSVTLKRIADALEALQSPDGKDARP